MAPGPGGHLCAVADRPAVRAELAASWIREGLDRGERVLWIAPDSGVLDWLTTHGVAWEEPLGHGHLAVVPPAEMVGLGSERDVPACIARAGLLVDQTVARGYAGLRVGVETAVALTVMPDVATQLRLEAAWEQHTRAHAMSLLCVYDPQVYGPDLGRAISAHPRGLTDGMALLAADGGTHRLSGEVDVSNADMLGDLIAEAAAGGMLLDLSGLSFIDVSGVTRLVEASRALAPGRLRVACPPRLLERILDAVGWGDELEVVGAAA